MSQYEYAYVLHENTSITFDCSRVKMGIVIVSTKPFRDELATIAKPVAERPRNHIHGLLESLCPDHRREKYFSKTPAISFGVSRI